MLKIITGLFVGFLIGAGCRWFDIPLPGPPKLVGAVLVLSVTAGYVATGRLIEARSPGKRIALNEQWCGGPNGEVISRSVSQSKS
ncbi:conserved hypothetical protein [Candidatus Koribacter versatilis Ellin345]|uniref:XapX domain-containing protein n=1 Tax=Koribacter versatilis (strain Ellin345) TaxID=204669 RepID=Q1IK60_KORVE|nr:conserved hypothetical protein [Candidatus Koribacter versatilis Ellin345]